MGKSMFTVIDAMAELGQRIAFKDARQSPNSPPARYTLRGGVSNSRLAGETQCEFLANGRFPHK